MAGRLQRGGRAFALFTGALLLASALWFGWKGPAMGFDPVLVWMYGGGTLFFVSMAGFFAARHESAAWRWIVVAIIHSLALAAFGEFVNATGLGVRYDEWAGRGYAVARVESMLELLGLYLLGTFVTSAVCFRILRRYAE